MAVRPRFGLEEPNFNGAGVSALVLERDRVEIRRIAWLEVMRGARGMATLSSPATVRPSGPSVARGDRRSLDARLGKYHCRIRHARSPAQRQRLSHDPSVWSMGVRPSRVHGGP